MPELAGKDCVIKISGALVPFTGEATTATNNTDYQITDTTKQVLDRTGAISVHKRGADDSAEAGTNTTTLKMTTHGLANGDIIINASRSNAVRVVTKGDNDTLTMTAITGQTTGDTIQVYKIESPSAYTLNRLSGNVHYDSATARTIRVTGNYYPMAAAAYATSMSIKRAVEVAETPRFLQTNKTRITGLHMASGTLTDFDVPDTTFLDALTSGDLLVVERRRNNAGQPDRYWASIDSDEIQAAIGAEAQKRVVGWQSNEAWLTQGI